MAMLLGGCDSTAEDHDLTHFAQWQQSGSNKVQSAALQSYLTQKGVGNVLPLRQLLRSDVKWRKCAADPFAVPPKVMWPNMVPTLKVIRAEVIPMVGPVEAQSVFRGPDINRCIKGASESTHLLFHAIDMRPTKPMTRKQLMKMLCKLHSEKGKALNMGLGIYSGTRFHIDTAGFRRWGPDYRAASSPCIGFVAPQRKSR
jgi:hypothetical protein